MIIETIWQDFLKIVREEVGSRVVETWFKAVRLVRWDDYEKVAYLEAPNFFVQEWVSTHYKDLFSQHLGRLLNEQSISIVFLKTNQKDTQSFQDTSSSVKNDDKQSSAVIKTGSAIQDNSYSSEILYKPARTLMNSGTRSIARRPAVAKLSGRVRGALNPSYKFDTFVVGPSNKLAFSAARAAAENAGVLYNPLFIYGGSGLGKTHLLHAVGNQIKELYKDVIVLYQSANLFVNDFINAIRFNKVYQFEARYKDVDVLLIDDIQFISNKEQTQETFFHIFNMLHQANKQIVFTSDSMPCDIAGLAERMRSRLEGGLIADIQLPTLETMIAILQQKAETHGQPLPDDVAYYVVSQGYSNIRELEGALIRIMAFASLTREPLTCEMVQKVLLQSTEKKKEIPSLHAIAAPVAKHFGYTLNEIRSSSRQKDLARTRHVAMFLMKKITDCSFREIGQFLKRKDHSTVIHAYEKIKNQCEVDKTFSYEMRSLEKNILSS